MCTPLLCALGEPAWGNFSQPCALHFALNPARCLGRAVQVLRKLEETIKEELCYGDNGEPMIDVDLVRKDKDNPIARCARVGRRGAALRLNPLPHYSPGHRIWYRWDRLPCPANFQHATCTCARTAQSLG